MPLRSICRYLRISLRALLLAVTVASIALGILAHRANRQREIVRLIRAQSGIVAYDNYDRQTFPGMGGADVVSGPDYPEWLIRALGIDFFHDVVEVKLTSGAVTDETLAAVATLPHLEGLVLYKTSVSEAGLHHLERMTSLRSLSLNTPGVSDETLALIASLPVLHDVSVFSALVTDDGLAKFHDCRNIEYLYFEDTDITEEALTQFHERHPSCRTGYSSPGFKTTAWAPKSTAADKNGQGHNVH